MQNETRNQGLDLLRAIAVFLVLARHSNLNFWLTKFGWLGVDLFLVLSGFLVSGLLFAEYKKRGEIRLGRFLAKRALKIVPPFYVFLLITIAVESYAGGALILDAPVLSECLFLQSYLQGRWLHTWSIGLEVHFYLLLAISALLQVNIRKKFNPKTVLACFIALLLACFLLRLQFSYPHRQDRFFAFFATHLRFDGIVCGVFLAYLHHFTNYTRFILERRLSGLLLAAGLIAPAFYFQAGTYFMNTIGLSLVNLGFALILLLALNLENDLQHAGMKFLRAPLHMAAFIGLHSYSVYLWHLNAKSLLYHYLHLDEKIMTVLYVLFATALGIGMSYLVEQPLLKLRKKRFPDVHSMKKKTALGHEVPF